MVSQPVIDRQDKGAAGALARGPASLTRLNTILGWSLFCVAAAAPIPLGSNRPFFWCLWGGAVGAVGLWYLLSARALGAELRIPLSAVRLLSVPFLLVALFILVQALPLGGIVPIRFGNQFGESFASGSVSVAPGDTWLALLRWTTYGAFYFLMLQAAVQSRRNRLLMQGLVAVAAAEAAYALLALTQLGDTVLFFDKVYYQGMATGTFVNRNSLATFLGLGAVAATALATGGAEARARAGLQRALPGHPFLLLAILVMMMALIATQSRMGLFSTMAGIGTVLVLRRAGGGGTGNVLLIAGGVAVLLALYGAGVGERFLTTERSAETRMELYRQVVAMIRERPLLGYGAGSFNQAFPLFHEPSLAVDRVWEYAHSTYLALWSGLGVVVGTIPILLLAAIVFRTWQASSPGEGRRSAESAAALGATVTVALHSLTDFSLEMQAVALFYVSMLALGSAGAIHGTMRERR